MHRTCILALLVLLSLNVSADPSARAESATGKHVWEKALSLQEEGKYEEAATHWLLVLSDENAPARSSAHWNVGLCCVHLQLPECVAYHWLESVKQSTSPSHIARVTQALTQFQSSLGLPTSTTSSIRYLMAATIGANHALIALVVAGWTFFAGLIALGRSRSVPRFVWFLVCAVFLGWGGLAHYSAKMLGRFHSIGNDGKDVPLYSSAEQTNPIASLPAGTIVYTDGEKDSKRQIESPVPGWIPADSLSRPISEMKGFLRGAKHSAAR